MVVPHLYQSSMNMSLVSDFERNPRRQFERRMRPVADILYWQIIPGITRIDRDYPSHLPLPLHLELGVLDKELGLDVIFTLKNGMRLTCQEKFNSADYAALEDVTVEHYNDPILLIPGDWFTMIAQLYFFGFAARDYKSFSLWVLLDWPKTVLETIKGNISWQRKCNTKGGAKADFMKTLMVDLPNDCILDTNLISKQMLS